MFFRSYQFIKWLRRWGSSEQSIAITAHMFATSLSLFLLMSNVFYIEFYNYVFSQKIVYVGSTGQFAVILAGLFLFYRSFKTDGRYTDKKNYHRVLEHHEPTKTGLTAYDVLLILIVFPSLTGFVYSIFFHKS